LAFDIFGVFNKLTRLFKQCNSKLTTPSVIGSGAENSTGIPAKILSSGRYDRLYRGGQSYLLLRATAVTPSRAVEQVWIAIRRPAIRGFPYEIFSGIPVEF
jgi:hypothetical protein